MAKTASAQSSFEYNCRIDTKQPSADDCDLNAVRDDCERPGLEFKFDSVDVPGASSVQAYATVNKDSIAVASNEFLFLTDQIPRHPIVRQPIALPPPVRQGERVNQIIVADFTGDKRDDLVIRREYSIVLMSSQENKFAEPRLLNLDSLEGSYIRDAALLGGVNSRSLLISTEYQIWEALNPFAASTSLRPGPKMGSANLTQIDIDGDGANEGIATASEVAHLLRSTQEGIVQIGSYPVTRNDLEVMDSDGDGDQDIATLSSDKHAAAFLINSSGNFSAQISPNRSNWRRSDYIFGIFRSNSGEDIPMYGERGRVWLGVRNPKLVEAQFSVPATDLRSDFNSDGLVDFAGIRDQRLHISTAQRVKNETMLSCDVDTFTPTGGGNNGRVTITLRGKDLQALTGAELISPPLPKVSAVVLASSLDGRRAVITFPLYSVPPGKRKLTLRFGAKERTLPADFEVRAGTECRGLIFNLIGPGAIRTGQESDVSLAYSNPCDIDVNNTLFWMDLPQDVKVVRTSPSSWPATLGPDPGNEVVIPSESGQRVGALEPVVAPGASSAYTVTISPTQTGDVRVSFKHSEFTDADGVPSVPATIGDPGQNSGAESPPPSLADGEAISKCMGAVGEHMAKKFAEGIIQSIQDVYPAKCVASVAGHVYKVGRTAIKAANGGLASDGNSRIALADISFDLAKTALKCAEAVGKNYPVVKVGNALAKTATFAWDSYKLFRSCKDNAGAIDGVLQAIGSQDPNDIIGPVNDCKNAVSRNIHSFMIRFENSASASASARHVSIKLALENLNLPTLRVTAIGLGGRTFPVGLTEEQNRLLELRPWFPHTVAFSLKREKNEILFVFDDFDLAKMSTSDDPRAGFLPPNAASPNGEGFVVFTTAPLGGDNAAAIASIVFDDNQPIETNRWTAKVVSDADCNSVAPKPSTNNSEQKEQKEQKKRKSGCGCSSGMDDSSWNIGGLLLAAILLAARRRQWRKHLYRR